MASPGGTLELADVALESTPPTRTRVHFDAGRVSGWRFEVDLGSDRATSVTRGITQDGSLATRLRTRLEQTHGPLDWTCVDGDQDDACEGWSAKLAHGKARITCCETSCTFAVGREPMAADCGD